MRRVLIFLPLLALVALIAFLFLRRSAAPPLPPPATPEKTMPPLQHPVTTDPAIPSRPTETPTNPPAPDPQPRSGSLTIFTHTEGQPLRDVKLLLLRQEHDGKHDPEQPIRAVTGTDGRAELSDVPWGDWELIARHESCVVQHREFTLNANFAGTLALEMPVGSVLHGRVTAATGGALPGAQISILDPETLVPVQLELRSDTDAAGFYRIEGIPVGTFVVHARHPRYKPAMQKDVLFSRGGELRQIDLVLEAGTMIAGRVLDHSGLPIAGAMVGASNENAGVVKTDAEGRFVIQGLGNEPVNLFARAPGFGATYRRGIPPGTTDLEFRIFPAGSISGRVTGNPPPKSFAILLYRFEEDLQKELLVQTQRFRDSSGTFRLPDVTAGIYQITLEADGYRTPERIPVRVAIGENVAGLVLTVEPKE